jgi:hypothetical protein
MAEPNGPHRPSDSAKPPAAKGASLGRPGHKGFIPPSMNRQKVEVARPQPKAPIVPQIMEPLPATALVDPVITVDAPVRPNAPVPPKARPTPRRPLIRYYVGGILSGILLLLAAIAAGFWVHSFGAIDRAIYATSSGEYYWIESYSGALYFHTERDPRPVERQLDFWRFEFGDPWAKKDPPPAASGAGYRGMKFNMATLSSGQKVQYTVISYWLLVVLLALPAVVWLRSRKRLAARCKRARCVNCGHDMALSPDRCPSCGTPGPASMNDGAEQSFTAA